MKLKKNNINIKKYYIKIYLYIYIYIYMATQKKLFIDTSDLVIDPTTRIISLSDIHGDIDVLIIALRDCAKVIEPNSGIPSIHNNIRDPELDRLLNLDLLQLDNMLEFDRNSNLGFKWIGGNTHVVIVGDMLDSIRKDTKLQLQTAPLTGKRNANDIYPQAEIKIIKFLNKLDEMAEATNGRVIKLVGNHEMKNFIRDSKLPHSQQYATLYTHDPQELMPYIDSTKQIKTLTRLEYFNFGQPGFDLFVERGTGVFLLINNILFMHALTYNNIAETTYKWCNFYNAVLTQKDSQNYYYFSDLAQKLSQLWDRDYGDDDKINKRMVDETAEKKFCGRVVEDFRNFLQDHPDNILARISPENFKVVVGHCPQSWSTWYNETNRTFSTRQQVDENTVELLPPANTFKASPAQTNNNNLFGISMECPTQAGLPNTSDPSDQHHLIYKVDVGASRGFDQTPMYTIPDHTTLKTYFLTRVPQVIEFSNNNVRIIRSTLKNTRIHQYRDTLERGIEYSISTGKLGDDFRIANLTYGGYKEKYLKYKSKYLGLKQKLK